MLPTKQHADIVVPRGAENDVAISLISQHIRSLLREPHEAGSDKWQTGATELLVGPSS